MFCRIAGRIIQMDVGMNIKKDCVTSRGPATFSNFQSVGYI